MTTLHMDADQIQRVYHLDADNSFFMARSLEKVKSAVYEQKFQQLKARTHIPMTQEPLGNGVETVTYEFYTSTGAAKVASSYTTDWPRQDVKAQEFSAKIKSLVGSYGYSFQDMRAAIQAKKDLSTRKALATRRAIAELENDLAYTGDPESGIVGLFTNPNIPIKTAAYAITSASTADQIIQVVNDALNTPIELTNGVEQPDTLLMPIDAYTYMNTTPRSSLSDTTILSFLKSAHPGVQFDWCNQCKTAGIGGDDILFAYVRDPQHVTLEVASDFEQLPPDIKSRETEINCLERFGGVFNYYPLACLIVEGV